MWGVGGGEVCTVRVCVLKEANKEVKKGTFL